MHAITDKPSNIAGHTYRLLDSGNFQKLEDIGPYRIIRPAAQAVWEPKLNKTDWVGADFTFVRNTSGDGKWEAKKNKKPDQSWSIEQDGIVFKIRLTGFGHLGIFPEQENNWHQLSQITQEMKKILGHPPKVLNLFAYTGGSSLACARGGAEVTHVDASKTTVAWARENAELCARKWDRPDLPIRWLIDDAESFVLREIRRGSQYDGIILDPPSFGRGPKNELWKIEEQISELLRHLQKILTPGKSFVLLSAHSPGFSPLVLKGLLMRIFGEKHGEYTAGEMIISAANSPSLALPSGASCLYRGLDN